MVRTDHYSWMSGLLLELGITSLRELADLLPAVDSVPQRMGYRYPPGAVRRLDDTLLASSASATSACTATPTASTCFAPAWPARRRDAITEG